MKYYKLVSNSLWATDRPVGTICYVVECDDNDIIRGHFTANTDGKGTVTLQRVLNNRPWIGNNIHTWLNESIQNSGWILSPIDMQEIFALCL